PAAATIDLTALDGEVHLAAAWIAGDEPHLGAEHVLQNACEVVRIRAGAFAGQGERLGQHVLPGLNRRRVPGRAQAGIAGDTADPGECATIELRVSQQRLERRAASDRGNDAAALSGGSGVMHRRRYARP